MTFCHFPIYVCLYSELKFGYHLCGEQGEGKKGKALCVSL